MSFIRVVERGLDQRPAWLGVKHEIDSKSSFGRSHLLRGHGAHWVSSGSGARLLASIPTTDQLCDLTSCSTALCLSHLIYKTGKYLHLYSRIAEDELGSHKYCAQDNASH